MISNQAVQYRVLGTHGNVNQISLDLGDLLDAPRQTSSFRNQLIRIPHGLRPRLAHLFLFWTKPALPERMTST